MTQGFAFLLAILLEGAAAAAAGWCLAACLDLSRFSASLRCLAAAVIGTGVTHPALWLWFSHLVELTGSWWGGAVLAQGLVILIETLFYAAALRGHWRLSLGLSGALNLLSFGSAFLLNWLLIKPA